jgi:hypothetical protein
MQSKYEEEIVRRFSVSLTKSEAGEMAMALREWEAYGEIGYPPNVFRDLRKELDRMIAESEDQ